MADYADWAVNGAERCNPADIDIVDLETGEIMEP